MKIELLFKILAVILFGVAAFFLWRNNLEWAFAAAVLCACAYFLSMRFQIKARLHERKPPEEAEEIAEEEKEEDLPE
jgi:Ca2+/Na+ antiporter